MRCAVRGLGVLDMTGIGNEAKEILLRRAIQLLVCFSLILVSGPLAPCKLEQTLMNWSAPGGLKISSRAVVNSKVLTWRAAAGQDDDDSDGDASCWCSVHMSVQDAAGPSIDVPLVVALLTPETIDLISARAEASPPVSYALEPPIFISDLSLPLLI